MTSTQKRQSLRCCVCIGLTDSQRPDSWQELELTIVNGFLVCTEHGSFAGPNTAWTAWQNAQYVRVGPPPTCGVCGEPVQSSRIPLGRGMGVYTHFDGTEHTVDWI